MQGRFLTWYLIRDKTQNGTAYKVSGLGKGLPWFPWPYRQHLLLQDIEMKFVTGRKEVKRVDLEEPELQNKDCEWINERRNCGFRTSR